MSFKPRILNHFAAIRACLPRFDAQAEMNLETYVLEVRARSRYFHLQPQFVMVRDGAISYTRSPDAGNVTGFAGWLPYLGKRWPIASGKFPFKEFCLARGLRTPAHSRTTPDGMRAFVVKASQSSFGRGLCGPFARFDQTQARQMLPEAGYYEEFIAGRVLKCWYWNERLVSVEMSEMAQVAGDGKRSARALVEQSRGGGPLPLDWAELADMLAFQGVKPDDVIEAGRAVVTDMRYGATRLVAQLENTNQLVALAGSAIERQLAAAGLEFLKAIPEELRGSGTMYTVDAIADSEDRVWFLEANCNSTVHPDAYFGMFEGLFGRAGPPRAVAPQQQGAPMRALPADQVPARMAAARPAALPRGLS